MQRKRRQEKTREDKGPGTLITVFQKKKQKTIFFSRKQDNAKYGSNTGNAKKSDTSEQNKSKICAPSFPYEIENEKDKQKENKEIKLKQNQNLKNIFKLKLPNKTGNKDLFTVTNPEELNGDEIKESKKEINETKKSGKNIKIIEDKSTEEHEIIAYNIKSEKMDVHKNIKKVIIFILIIIILILNEQLKLIPNNNLKNQMK